MPQCVLPAGRIRLAVNLSSVIALHLWSLKRWSFLISSASPASPRQRTKVDKKRNANEWQCGGTNESCSSAHLTLSNYLASPFNGGVSEWDKSELTWEILKDLGVRDKLTEWVLMSLLRRVHSHTIKHANVMYVVRGHKHKQPLLFLLTCNQWFHWTFRIEWVT